MDSRLFMEVGVQNSTFQAIDKSPYERWINDGHLDNLHSHAKIQRLVSISDAEENTLIDSDLVVASTVEELRNPWEVERLKNGLYYYQKLLLPTQGHVTAANEILWYEVASEKVFYYDNDSQEISIYDPIEDFDDIYSLVRKEYPDNCFYFDDYTFTIYDLVRCYVLAERDRINNYFKNNCKEACNKNSDLQQRVDILLAAIMVINDLLERGDFFEAQRILNGLNTCGSLCKEFVDQGINSCGCGTT